MKSIIGDVIKVKGSIGANIFDSIEECIKMAQDYDCNIVLKFNGRELQISKTDTIDAKGKEYFK